MQRRPNKGQLCRGVCSVYTVGQFSGRLHREAWGSKAHSGLCGFPTNQCYGSFPQIPFQFSLVPGQEEASCYSMTNQGWTDASPNRGIWSPLWVPVINTSCCSVESEWEPCDPTGSNTRRRTFTEPFLCARQCPRAPAQVGTFLTH